MTAKKILFTLTKGEFGNVCALTNIALNNKDKI